MPEKQSSYSPTPTQATQGPRGPGGGGGEPKSMAGAPGVQNMMGGLFGGLLGGSRQGNVTPTSVKAFMPSGGGGLLGGLLGAARYTSIRDMFNGGGPGRAGERFYGGGMLSAGLNRAGVRPAGYQGLMAAMASQAAQKAAQPGYTPSGYGAPPTGGLGAPAGTPAPSGGLGGPTGGLVADIGAPLLGSGMTPANAYATAPVAPMTYGSPMPTGMFSTPTQPFTNTTLPTTGAVPGAYPTTSRYVSPEVSRSQSAYQAMLQQLFVGSGATPAPATPTGQTAVQQSQAGYADMLSRLEARQRAEAQQRAQRIYEGMMVAP